MLNIAILGSTKGTDLQTIIDAINDSILKDVKIAFVLCNKENAYILQCAKNYGLNDIYLNPKNLSRNEYDEEITKLLKAHNVDLILLIGYMKLMSNEFVQQWRNRVMNIHPSLLPSFAGGMDLNIHAAVLKRGCKVTGASLIFIDEGADTGPIILQEVVKVGSTDTSESLKEKVQQVEQKLLIEAIKLFRDGKIKVNSNGIVEIV